MLACFFILFNLIINWKIQAMESVVAWNLFQLDVVDMALVVVILNI